ncbi:hypothetical protein PSTG_12879 [Puccinia striiformis f. sp. tritici PST-78]|uniref:DNA polymerase beta n=1 Tax=Puccinia striiformis f. sp. tritici PST-78 TaxID=1165861 RepID=A0A0L0V3L8_9BASI|nr:hypothetical protein PSTG_12879 [Puccinia striiformis f. sp. tritici PST-78]
MDSVYHQTRRRAAHNLASTPAIDPDQASSVSLDTFVTLRFQPSTSLELVPLALIIPMDHIRQPPVGPSRKRPYCEPSTSRKRFASSLSDTFDSQTDEIHEWRQSSIAWKNSYDQKVAQCLKRNQPPIGPVEKYLKLISPDIIEDQETGTIQHDSPHVVSAPAHSCASEVEHTRQGSSTRTAGPAEIPDINPPHRFSTVQSRRIVLAPETPCVLLASETPGVSLTTKPSSALLAPETPASPSVVHLAEKASNHVPSPQFGITTQDINVPQTKQSTSHECMTVVNSSPPTRGSSSTVRHHPSRSLVANSFGIHRTTSQTSASSGIKMKSVKLSQRGSKVKEVETLDAYDKLTAKERSARFPKVHLWADFLVQSSKLLPKKGKSKDFMKRCRIYYLIDPTIQQNLNDADRMRMRKLFEAGAQIQGELRAKQVTHIIVRDGTSWNSCLRAIKSLLQDPAERQVIKDMCMSSLDKIPGEELVWIMDFKWVTNCLSYGAIPAEKYTCIRPRTSQIFKPPIPVLMESPGSPVLNRSQDADQDDNSSYDEIETSISLKPNVHHMAHNPKVTAKVVPGLECQLQLARLGEGSESGESEDEELEQRAHSSISAPAIPEKKTKGRTRHASDKPGNGAIKRNGPNEDICQKLEQIIELYGCNPNDNFRVIAIRKAANVLRTQTKRVDDFDALCKLEGIGPKTAQKILDIANTSTHRRLQLETEQDTCRARFKGIYGVSQTLALKWYHKGLRTLDDVRDRKGGISLSISQEIGLRYYDDLQERISRKEVELIIDQVNKAAVRVDPKLKVLLMGSYCRGEESCGNIEVIVTRNNSDGQTYHDSMSRLYKRLRKDGLITYELSVGKKADKNNLMFPCLCAIKQSGFDKQGRIDLLGVPFNQLGAALIYFTGNEIFNRSLRLKARQMGYTLNQKGLFGSAPTDDFQSRFNQLITPSAIPSKLAHSSSSSSSSSKTCLVASKTEEEIFEILNVPFLLPHERNL